MQEKNEALSLAADFIRQTNRSLYLTGKAGTGKTTFLHELQKKPPKRLVVTAPTGVAAINARGVTLHSFFQLPFSPYVPGTETDEQLKLHRMRREKLNIIKSMELLVIDEISMVRADTLDAIDTLLRRHRRNAEPFGGVQLLMIGDVHQLSPVVKRDEASLLSSHYFSNYFFSSHALQQTDWLCIELTQIYRQSDAGFINILNQVRNNCLDAKGLAVLNARCDPQAIDVGDMITLTSHNAKAERINQEHMHALASQSFAFTAQVAGDFPEYAYPTDRTLGLKKGAQVMFVRNDPTPDKRYFNGKLGTVVGINDEEISVRCEQLNEADPTYLRVERATWENYKYSINEETNAIEEKVVGTFIQFPLKLAWAITIHKSQGLTFDKIAIDAAMAFSHGQVYVALSRCRSLEGIFLRAPIPMSAIKTDKSVSQFLDEAMTHSPTRAQLENSKIHYQQKLIMSCFNFEELRARLWRFVNLIDRNKKVIIFKANEEPALVMNKMLGSVCKVGEAFQRQLSQHFNETEQPLKNEIIMQRIKDSHPYFQKTLDELEAWVKSINFSSDNRELKKEYKRYFDQVGVALAIKQAAIGCCEQGFETQIYLQGIAKAQINKDQSAKVAKVEKVETEYEASDVQHPKLLNQLALWRNKTADAQNIDAYKVLHQRILIQLVVRLPQDQTQLRRIKGVGPQTLEKYGDAILEMIQDYCQQHNVDLSQTSLPKKSDGTLDKATESDNKSSNFKVAHASRLKTYDYYKKGMSVDHIATERGFVQSTIEGHLAYFVGQGELKIEALMSPGKCAEIEAALAQFDPAKGLKPIRETLVGDYSYGEIKIVMAHLDWAGKEPV